MPAGGITRSTSAFLHPLHASTLMVMMNQSVIKTICFGGWWR